MIVSQEVDKGNAKLEDLEESIKIVSEDFIHDSISKGKKLSEDDYKLVRNGRESSVLMLRSGWKIIQEKS